MLRTQLRGTGTALITPFQPDFQVDYTALESLIEYVIKGGVEYVVTLGTTGEPATLSKEEKTAVLKFTLNKVNGRVPVVVGVGGNNTAELIHELKTLPLAGAAAVLSTSPYYSRPSQEGIFQHYKALAEASPLPLLLYNVPSRTGSNVTAATTLRLAKEVPNIIGIKEASGILVQCLHILRDKPKDFLVISGDDHFALPLIACGGDGVISVAANAFPAKFSALIRLALKGDFSGASTLLLELTEGIDLMFAENNPAGVKAFLATYKVIQNYMRLPVVPVSAPIMQAIEAYAPTVAS